MDRHEHFETLCVLAVTGQSAGRELLELTEHCENLLFLSPLYCRSG